MAAIFPFVKTFPPRGGKLIIGDVAFNTRDELEKCKLEAGGDWDDDEIYSGCYTKDKFREPYNRIRTKKFPKISCALGNFLLLFRYKSSLKEILDG